MNTLPVFVGLDYHQDSVQVSVLDGQGKQLFNRRCRNDWKEIVKAVKPWGQVQGAAIEVLRRSGRPGPGVEEPMPAGIWTWLTRIMWQD